ncbi:hypothetical protein F5X99DRAFT_426450 [Biscogniauxia marginata]|nr:hypothetical protein F5X99DRAFT_426450 [Biscogniauxia marginata]
MSSLHTGADLTVISHPSLESGPEHHIPDNRHLVVRRRIPGMGGGLVATEDIARGTRIVAEIPILHLSELSADDEVLEFCKRLSNMPKEDIERIDSLYASTAVKGHIKKESWDTIREYYQSGQITNDDGQVVHEIELEALIESTNLRWTKFCTNSVWLSGGEESEKRSSAVFPLYSCINHSCAPNVVHAFNETIQRYTIHAMHEIKAGEQLFTDYGPGIGKSREDRAKEHSYWGFTCNCIACTDSEWQEKLDISRPLREMMEGLIAKNGESSTIENNREALELSHELQELYAGMGFYLEVSRLYRKSSKLALAIGDIASAIEYARKQLVLQELHYGTDTEFLRKSATGAQFWLKHLEALKKKKETETSDGKGGSH